jgi:LuxR family maltose regulon positive regulatory protein
VTNYHQQPGTHELLSTKLVAPHTRAPLVLRERLLTHLDEGLKRKITLISAPAGFGKTTLVSEWITKHRIQADLPPIAWVALDARDNDPVLFWRYVLTACREFGMQVSETALDLLSNSPQPLFETLLTSFINEVARLPGKVILVLEDYHAITSRQIHKTLALLIDHLPDTLHVVLITRSDPDLPLARLRAHNELNELRAADLRFTLEETRAYLQLTLPISLSSAVIKRLNRRTEGWAAGLHLVSLALQRMKEETEIEQYLTSFTGSHRPILEYLVADVFSAQPEDVQEFLLQTSVLSRLTGPLCDAITGREDGSIILEQLDRANLFLIALDSAGRWFRYHALFAEAMQHYAQVRLGGINLHKLAGKASFWYEEHGMLADAIEAALYAKEYQRSAALIERVIAPRLVHNEFHTLRRWMGQLPEAVLQAHPEICMTFASAILFTSDRHSPETKNRLLLPLSIAKHHWQREDNQPKLGEVLAFHSFVDWLQRDFKESFSFARQALTLLPDSDRQWRGISLIMVGLDELLGGKLITARRSFDEALVCCEAAENIFGILESMLLLGEVCYQQGELHQAAQFFNQVQARIEKVPIGRNQASIRTGRVQLGLGMLALEWDNLEAAEEAISQAAAVSQQYPEEDLLADSPVIMAQVQYAKGEVDQAQHFLESLIAQPDQQFLLRFPGVCQARFALASGNLAAVQRWASMIASREADTPPFQREQEALVVARLHIEQGEPEAAIRQLESWLSEALENGRTRSEIEINILLALAHTARGDSAQARITLIQALSLAHLEGYRRIFLDEGERLAKLLQNNLSEIHDESLAVYARALLDGMAQDQTEGKAAVHADSEPLIEQLTEQEKRVLRLLAAGLSNPEIAEELFISINTVKTHVKNVYGKLNVNSRHEARQYAHRVMLL